MVWGLAGADEAMREMFLARDRMPDEGIPGGHENCFLVFFSFEPLFRSCVTSSMQTCILVCSYVSAPRLLAIGAEVKSV